MQLAQKCLRAAAGFAGRLEDNQIHYGLIFDLPTAITPERLNPEPQGDCCVRKCSDLNTRSRHGTIQDWYLGAVTASPPTQRPVLLIPRTWLIRQGYLPWYVLFLPYRFFALRNLAALQQHFWLEWTDTNGSEIETDAVATALQAA